MKLIALVEELARRIPGAELIIIDGMGHDYPPQLWERWVDLVAGHVFAEIRAPVLTVGFTDDPIATPRTVEGINRFFPNVQRESRWYSPRDIGSRRIGHDGFFSQKHREGLWRPVVDWMASQAGATA